MKRCGKVTKDEPRTLIVIDGPGCSWEQCEFCGVKGASVSTHETLTQVDYCFSQIPEDETVLQIVSSASFSDYSTVVQHVIHQKVVQHGKIKKLIIEQRFGLHSLIEDIVASYAKYFIKVEVILGLEAVSEVDRHYLGKEQYNFEPEQLSMMFQRVNLLYGYKQKPIEVLEYELEECLKYFNVVSINIYETIPESHIVRDKDAVEAFYNHPKFQDWLANPRIHIFDSDPRAQEDFGGINTLETE